MMKILSIFKSSRKDKMYLYVDKREQLERVPEPLLEMFGKPLHVMDIPLTPERRLARVEVAKVLESLTEHGFYLQLPPKLPVEEEITRYLL